MSNNDLQYLPTPKFTKYTRKRALLPWWIKTFCWIFMIFAAFVPLAILFGLLHFNFQIEIFGIETNNPFSLKGVIAMAIFLFNGMVAYYLWTEKDGAIGLAKINAIINIAICVVVMVYFLVAKNHLNIRLELIPLFLFNYKLNKIQYDWENFDSLDEGIEYADPAAPVVAGE